MVEVYVPAGEFPLPGLKATTKVYLDAFWIDQTEVTNAMYAKFIASTGYKTVAERLGSGEVMQNRARLPWDLIAGANWQHPRGPRTNLDGLDNHPVVQMAWSDAQAYCAWAGRHLPTYAQWAKAAMGKNVYGNTADASLATAMPRAFVNLFNDGYAFTAPVGSYPLGKSDYDALDMKGNVFEWLDGWYDTAYYDHPPHDNPQGPKTGDVRFIVGGSWAIPTCESTCMNWSVPGEAMDDKGFRCSN